MNGNKFIKNFMLGKRQSSIELAETNGSYIRRFVSANWTTAQAATIGSNMYASQCIGAGYDRIDRYFGLFDLSGVVGTIIAARVIISNDYIANNCDYVSIQSCNNIGNLVLDDYDNFTSTLLGYDNTKDTIAGSIRANSVSFNVAGISKLNEKGIQRFVFRQGENDYSNVSPANGNSSSVAAYIPSKLILEII